MKCISELLTRGFIMDIKAVRQHKGITQQGLSEATGIDQSSISRMENGKQGISLKNLYQIANALGEPVESFFNQSQAG
jgi:transcriptional regulator with XRE-family HTH domain